jgi:hypothetical protein
MRQNSKGFGVIEVILIIVIVALIALVCWKAWEAYSGSRVDPGQSQQDQAADAEVPEINSSPDLDTASEALDSQAIEGDEAQKVEAETSF